ncbi:alpha/beta hydrolase [Pleurocapsales cyanobacterium LEGE 06147]|nr:alpha/beta hydrolase [Pleurocapsales cyanobacterium LEGE 06147]
MSKLPYAIWLDTNPHFRRFNHLLTNYLSRQTRIAHWEYYQNQDEASSLDIALILFHDYLKSLSRPINLIGHSTGGLLGLLYARKYPERVKSLTLLGVGFHPAIDWQTHYYTLRQLLPCTQEVILAQMVRQLFGYQDRYNTKGLSDILKQDLNTSPSPHSLYKRFSIAPGGVSMPLLVCGSKDDTIVDRYTLQGWQNYFKAGDSLWECPQGYHFFHYFYPQKVGKQILKFWDSLDEQQGNCSPKLSNFYKKIKV